MIDKVLIMQYTLLPTSETGTAVSLSYKTLFVMGILSAAIVTTLVVVVLAETGILPLHDNSDNTTGFTTLTSFSTVHMSSLSSTSISSSSTPTSSSSTTTAATSTSTISSSSTSTSTISSSSTSTTTTIATSTSTTAETSTSTSTTIATSTSTSTTTTTSTTASTSTTTEYSIALQQQTAYASCGTALDWTVPLNFSTSNHIIYYPCGGRVVRRYTNTLFRAISVDTSGDYIIDTGSGTDASIALVADCTELQSMVVFPFAGGRGLYTLTAGYTYTIIVSRVIPLVEQTVYTLTVTASPSIAHCNDAPTNLLVNFKTSTDFYTAFATGVCPTALYYAVFRKFTVTTAKEYSITLTPADTIIQFTVATDCHTPLVASNVTSLDVHLEPGTYIIIAGVQASTALTGLPGVADTYSFTVS